LGTELHLVPRVVLLTIHHYEVFELLIAILK
jgi:hypothetical protein